MMEDKKMVKVIQSRFVGKLTEPLHVKGRVNPMTCKKVWEVTMTFGRVCKEDGKEVVGIIPVGERNWVQAGRTWKVRNGVDCTGFHGQGHQINECFLAPYAMPHDQRPPAHQQKQRNGNRPFPKSDDCGENGDN